MGRARVPRGLVFWTGVGVTSVMSLVLFNLAADALPSQGLKQLRDFAIRRNG